MERLKRFIVKTAVDIARIAIGLVVEVVFILSIIFWIMAVSYLAYVVVV